MCSILTTGCSHAPQSMFNGSCDLAYFGVQSSIFLWSSQPRYTNELNSLGTAVLIFIPCQTCIKLKVPCGFVVHAFFLSKMHTHSTAYSDDLACIPAQLWSFIGMRV